MSTIAVERSQASTHSPTEFADIASFSAAVRDGLLQDTLFNTLLLSQLSEIEEQGTLRDEAFLATLDICSCRASGSKVVLLSPGLKGISNSLYISAAELCPHSADIISRQLQGKPNINRITTTARNADTLLQALPPQSWSISATFALMLCQPQQASPSKQHIRDPDTHHHHRQQQMRLRTCSASSPEDQQLVLAWYSSFLVQVFHLAASPSQQEVESSALPRLHNGLYSVVIAGDGPVCMISHVPTSDDSARITMLYTPEENRGRGYGRFAVTQLCQHLQQQGFRNLCLLAHTNEPGLVRLYEGCCFTAVGEMSMMSRQQPLLESS